LTFGDPAPPEASRTHLHAGTSKLSFELHVHSRILLFSGQVNKLSETKAVISARLTE
jgi:hypothetical protein